MVSVVFPHSLFKRVDTFLAKYGKSLLGLAIPTKPVGKDGLNL